MTRWSQPPLRAVLLNTSVTIRVELLPDNHLELLHDDIFSTLLVSNVTIHGKTEVRKATVSTYNRLTVTGTNVARSIWVMGCSTG